MKILDEDMTKLIHVSPDTNLTPAIIGDAINQAYGLRTFAKFYTDKFYIQVNFDRINQTITVASNIRSPQFTYDLYRNDKWGWNLPRVKAFIYQWMQISRRTLY